MLIPHYNHNGTQRCVNKLSKEYIKVFNLQITVPTGLPWVLKCHASDKLLQQIFTASSRNFSFPANISTSGLIFSRFRLHYVRWGHRSHSHKHFKGTCSHCRAFGLSVACHSLLYKNGALGKYTARGKSCRLR